jgi:hypothetical protein
MLLFKLSLALFVAMGTLVSCFDVRVDDNGNLVLQSSGNHINWGNMKPLDVLQKLREKCPEDGIGCSTAAAVELDTQVIADGKSYMRTLTLTITDSSYPGSATGGVAQLIQALQALVDSPPWSVYSKQHWDQDTEQSSCASVNDNYCWSACELIILPTPLYHNSSLLTSLFSP